MTVRRPWPLLFLAPVLAGADVRAALREALLPPLDDAGRAAVLALAARELGPEDLRWAAEAVRTRDTLAAHGVTDPDTVATYVDAALSPDRTLRERAASGAAWGGLRSPDGAIDAPTREQLAGWGEARLAIAPALWAVRTRGEEAWWVVMSATPGKEATVDPQVAGFEGPNFRAADYPLRGWTVVRGGERVPAARDAYRLLGLEGACPDQHVVLGYEATGARRAALVAGVGLSPGFGAGGPALTVGCGASGAPDRPAPSGQGEHLRWPCGPGRLDARAYREVAMRVPARTDACLVEEDVTGPLRQANEATLAALGMDRFDLPPTTLPPLTIPAVVDPSLDPATFADPE